MGRRATPVRHKWHLRLSLNGPRGDGGDGFERHRKEEAGREGGEEDEYAACPAALAAVECSACTHLGRGEEGIEGTEGGREGDLAAGRSLLQSIEREFLHSGTFKVIPRRVSVWSSTHLRRTFL